MKRVVPAKPPGDTKDYVGLVLENKLKLLLLSDPECDKAAMSVSVGVGSMNDPDDLPGLAHLCEHLLSIEALDTPGHKPFNIFISENGGMFNAFTSRDQTNFHFDICPTAFAEALQRFSKYFTTPRQITKADIEKEIKIVDAEHCSKINKDAWRKMGVDAATSRKDHPFHKFTTGNISTLADLPAQKGIDVVSAANEFRSKYYVSQIITVVVYAKEGLSRLEELAVPLLSQVPNNSDIKLPQWNDWPYGADELQRRIDIIPLADIKDFYVVFPIPNTRPFYKTFPHGYLTRLLGSRGPGSLYTYLYDNQWVEYSYMRANLPARGFGEFAIGFQLTNLGLNHIDQIILHTFQYLKMLKDKGPQYYFWQEMQEILSLQFLYPEKDVPVEFVQRNSNLLHVYPLEDILTIGSVVTDYNPTLLERFLGYLTPDNCRIITVCKVIGCDTNRNFLQDEWYGTQYSSRKFTEEEIKVVKPTLWNTCEPLDCFTLPNKNEYIAKNFDLKNEKISIENGNKYFWTPALIFDKPLGKAWFLLDEQFGTAKGAVRVELFSQLPLVDPSSYNLNQLWFLTLKNILSEEYYAATLAGLYHDLKPTLYGAELTVCGYSDKLLLLVKAIFSRIITTLEIISTVRKHFKTVKERYATVLANLKNLPAMNITTTYLSRLLCEKRFSNEQLLEALKDATEDNLIKYISRFFAQTRFEWLIYGNFTRQESESLVDSCFELVSKQWNNAQGLPSKHVPRMREVKISSKTDFIFRDSPLKSGSSCAILIQAGVLNIKENVILEIIDQLVHEPVFTQLRGREQVGYLVRSSVRRSNGCLGLLIFVQGDKTPSFIGQRIKSALCATEESIKNMKLSELEQHKNAVRVRKTESPKTMFALLNKLWNSEIYPRRYDFARKQKELAALEEITHKEIISFFRERLSTVTGQRRVLQVHLTSAQPENSDGSTKCSQVDEDDKNAVIITDILKWKKKMSLCPHEMLV